jgi:hypothetical protein
MSWEFVIFIASIVWAFVVIFAISAWHDMQKRKPRTIIDLLQPSERQLTTLSFHPRKDDESDAKN